MKRPRGLPSLAGVIAELRTLPINHRAAIIADVFRLATAEFAVMMLEHTRRPKPRRTTRRRKVR